MGTKTQEDMSEEEACKAIFQRLDTDGDGLLSEAELKVIFGDDAKISAAAALGEFDKNGDGGLDEAEWIKAMLALKGTGSSEQQAKLFSSINKCLDDGILWSKDMLA